MKSGYEKKVLTKQEQIALNAKRLPEISFTSIAYHMDIEWMYEAYAQTRKDGASGIDDVTAEEYAKNLEENLTGLLERAKTGEYKAPAVKRVYVPKGTGTEMRPIGIPTFEDKILQRAVKMVMEPIFEADFYECSYGFRKGKSAQEALERLWKNAMETNGWIIDLDISKYFDTIDHGKLREIVRQRVNDGVITRLIGKWLKAGIMEDGKLFYNKVGTPQGGVISPLISNIYLHEVLDKWFMNEVKPRMQGKVFMIRFADDAVIGFSNKEDASKVMEVLPKRFEKYGLTIHPEKTKIIRFSKPKNNRNEEDEENGSFNFLGFTHYWGKSKKGNYTIRRKTRKERLARAVKEINNWCRKNRHLPVEEQAEKLSKKINGHYAYYGITHNIRSLYKFFNNVKWIWYKWLKRRSRKKGISMDKFISILERVSLPKPRIVHSYI